uniref:PLD phosphodiesterase domain-containing protein n=2 Tax=Ralstonia syzygii TaxID=28097 RepID=G3A3Z7_9RALS|nr:conserved hypothetical protein [Ralstonia syzygii R24]
MTVLIPIDRYRVDYEIGYGTPFSSFDLIVLGAIAEDQGRGIADLARLLCLPQRVLVESVVSLTRIGWVAVGSSDEEFEVTHAGRIAIESGDPPRPEQIEARQNGVVMDRLTGQLATLRDVSYWTTKRLQETMIEGRSIWERAERLQRDPHLPMLDAGRVKPLLRRGGVHSGWIRWIADPIPQLEAWLKVDVGPEGIISGIPDVWRGALEPRLSELLGLSVPSKQEPREHGGTLAHTESGRSWWVASPEKLELVKGGAEHWAALQAAFVSAETQLLVASAFASADVLEKDLRPLVVAAVGRGVRVDLMWGYSKGGGEDEKTVRALKSIRAACDNGHLFRFNELPSGSHAKLLLWDHPIEGFRGCVGSNNWLSVAQADYGVNHFEVSAELRHDGVVSDLCTTVAGLWSRTEAPLAGASDIWHRTASELERRAIGGGDQFRVDGCSQAVDLHSEGRPMLSVVRDFDHEMVIRDLLLGASKRVGVVSHKLGPKAPIRLASVQYWPQASRGTRELQVIVGSRPENDGALREATELVHRMGGNLKVRAGVHAKLVVTDDTVLVSSFNPLSADPFGTAENAREVGVLIRSKAVADAAWAWIDELAKVPDA